MAFAVPSWKPGVGSGYALRSASPLGDSMFAGITLPGNGWPVSGFVSVTARATVLRHVVRRQHLHFLDRVDVLDADDGARRPRADCGRAVDGDVVFVGAAAVDVEAAVTEIREAA